MGIDKDGFCSVIMEGRGVPAVGAFPSSFSYGNDAVKAPEEIDVHAFHEALGLMYPLNWSTSENGEWETFMLQEMVCCDVTEIYARYGARYFRLRDVCNLSHAQITTRIKEEFNLFRK